MKLVFSLLWFLCQKRPDHVFCGHIKLAVLTKTLCKLLGIPYTVLTYGKEVWEPLESEERQCKISSH